MSARCLVFMTGRDSVVLALKPVGAIIVLRSIDERLSLLLCCVGGDVYFGGVQVSVLFMERSGLQERLVLDGRKERIDRCRWSVFTIVMYQYVGYFWEEYRIRGTRVKYCVLQVRWWEKNWICVFFCVSFVYFVGR